MLFESLSTIEKKNMAETMSCHILVVINILDDDEDTPDVTEDIYHPDEASYHLLISSIQDEVYRLLKRRKWIV